MGKSRKNEYKIVDLITNSISKKMSDKLIKDIFNSNTNTTKTNFTNTQTTAPVNNLLDRAHKKPLATAGIVLGASMLLGIGTMSADSSTSTTSSSNYYTPSYEQTTHTSTAIKEDSESNEASTQEPETETQATDNEEAPADQNIQPETNYVTPEPEYVEPTYAPEVQTYVAPTEPEQTPVTAEQPAPAQEESNTITSPNSGVNYYVHGHCIDGMEVYGDPSARGKANQCYGHGGWLDY